MKTKSEQKKFKKNKINRQIIGGLGIIEVVAIAARNSTNF